MIATIEMFRDLDVAGRPDELRQQVYQRAAALTGTEGLLTKVWFNDPRTREFGAFLLWEDRRSVENFQSRESAVEIGRRWGVVPTISNYDVYQTLVNARVLRDGDIQAP